MRRRPVRIVVVILGVLFSLGLALVLTGVVSRAADLFPDSWLGTFAFAVLALALIAWMTYGAHRDWVKKGRPKTKWHENL